MGKYNCSYDNKISVEYFINNVLVILILRH